MATGSVWENVPGQGLVLRDAGTSDLSVGMLLPGNVDGEHFAATGNMRIAGTEGEGTPAGSLQGYRPMTLGGSTTVENDDEGNGVDPSTDEDPPDDPDTDTDDFRTLKEVFLGGLEQIGLDNATAQSLWEWAESRFVADSSFTAAQASVEMKDQKAFKDRFPGIASMRAEQEADGSPAARRDIPTPAEYLARERLWATHLGKYGMSALGADLNTMVAQSYMKSIGEGEFVDRLKAASEMIYEAPEAVKTTFGDWFGNHADAALMAVFLDPSNEVFNDDWVGLKGDVAAAEVGGWSKMHLGLDAPVTQERSRAIAGLGWRDIDIWEGLDRLKAKEDLFIERIGEVDYQMEVEGVAAEFGIDTEALSGVELNELIDRRATRRSADFSGGGGAMLTGTTTGFGAANA
tara:strand:+ start:296 stop:1507 length:1212 start_codon:yes stop_codon:yes gene_type:complete